MAQIAQGCKLCVSWNESERDREREKGTAGETKKGGGEKEGETERGKSVKMSGNGRVECAQCVYKGMEAG